MERKVSSGWGESSSGRLLSFLFLLFLLFLLLLSEEGGEVEERDSRAMSWEKGKYVFPGWKGRGCGRGRVGAPPRVVGGIFFFSFLGWIFGRVLKVL